MKKIILLTIVLFVVLIINSGVQLSARENIRKEANSRIDNCIIESINIGFNNDVEIIADEATSEKSEDSEIESPSPNPDMAQDKKLTYYSKFDFVAGDQIIFYDNFIDDPVGEFPAKWNTNNSGEVVKLEGVDGKWFNIPADGGNYFPELDLKFPENVTIEFDMVFDDDFELGMTYYSEENFDVDAYGLPGEAGFEVFLNNSNYSSFKNYQSEDNGLEINSESNKGNLNTGEINHVSLWMQKTRFRLYINETKAFDIPKGVFGGFAYNRFRFTSYNSASSIFVSNVRIAVGAPDTRNQLITDGKLVTRGILFDVNSDKIKPESYGCIKEIADVLKENPTVEVTIVGHTDSDGDDTKNLDLSKRRATSVKSFLVSEFNIETTRMATDGKGESEPVESNTTAVGKAQNRRVEFIKK